MSSEHGNRQRPTFPTPHGRRPAPSRRRCPATRGIDSDPRGASPDCGRTADRGPPTLMWSARLTDLDTLVAASTKVARLSDVATDHVLEPPRSTGNLAGPPVIDEDWLVISTVHSAKGLEWDVVHLLHVNPTGISPPTWRSARRPDSRRNAECSMWL